MKAYWGENWKNMVGRENLGCLWGIHISNGPNIGHIPFFCFLFKAFYLFIYF